MMAENMQQLREQETAAREQQESKIKESTIQEASALCRHCGAALDPEFPFCPSCGEKVNGGEYTCEFCQTKTSKEICPHCGRRVIPLPCPNCRTPTIYDACENCGAIINPVLEKALDQEAPVELAQMSHEEAEKIEADFKAMELNESAEFKAFQKKLIERQILLEERDYFTKREKRIIKAFGSRPFTLELPDPAEEAFRMKAYAALEKTVVEREEKLIEAELEKMFPPLPPVDTSAEDARLLEIERIRAEMDQNFNEALAKVNTEVDAFREAERKRKEEEARREAEAERKRQMEIERRRLEEERRRKRVNGTFYYRNNDFEMTLQITGMSKGQAYYNCFVCHGNAYLYFDVNSSGDTIRLRCNCLSSNTCGFSSGSSGHNDDRLNFTGNLNSSGTILTGYWGNGRGSFRSQFFGGDQSSASSGTFYKR
jgi:hypothetical protein